MMAHCALVVFKLFLKKNNVYKNNKNDRMLLHENLGYQKLYLINDSQSRCIDALQFHIADKGNPKTSWNTFFYLFSGCPLKA